jgi:putative redox protein
MAEIRLRWVEEKVMLATGSNHHSVVIGRTGEEWKGIKPSELLLMAAASCSTWDIVEILAKQREPLDDLQVVCSGEQMQEPPYSFTKIHLHYIACGPVNPGRLEKAIRLSEEKYCSVISTLRHGVTVTSDYEIAA